MNNTEVVLLSAVIIILLGLVIYSVFTSSKPSKKERAAMQAETFMNILSEYAQKVQEEKQKTTTEDLAPVDVAIPTKVYPKFDSSRAMEEIGLTREEADTFVLELIKVVEAEIVRIEEALRKNDMKTIETIVHTITGSSSTLGSGGITSALISFYAAVQHRDNMQILQIHLENVKYYLGLLKEENGVA